VLIVEVGLGGGERKSTPSSHGLNFSFLNFLSQNESSLDPIHSPILWSSKIRLKTVVCFYKKKKKEGTLFYWSEKRNILYY
jgi:hypothetical protein